MTDNTELKINKTDYTCEECYRSYYTEKGLQIHEDRIHGEDE